MPRYASRATIAASLAFALGCGGSHHKTVLTPAPSPPTPLTRAKVVFLSDRDGQPDLYLLDPVDSSVTRVTDDAAPELYPVLSPDSAWIAFMEPVGAHRDVFVVGVDGTNEKNVTQDPGADDGPPRWSADGAWIYYTRGVPGTPSQVNIVKIHPDGSDPTPVTQDGATVLLDARLDGGQILANRYTGLWTMGVDGSGQALLDTAAVSAAEYSPSGTRIAYSAVSIGGTRDVYVLNANATGRLNITNGAFDTSDSPTWSPDETQIVFHASDHGGATNLYAIAPNGTGLTPVTQEPAFDGEAYWGPK